MYFGIPPGSPKAEARQKVEGKKSIQMSRRQTKSRLPITCADILRLLYSTDDWITVQIDLIT